MKYGNIEAAKYLVKAFEYQESLSVRMITYL